MRATHPRSVPVILWCLTGLSLGNWLGGLPDYPISTISSIPFWSWMILWPLNLLRLLILEAPEVLAIFLVTALLLIAVVWGFVRWNWPKR